MNTRPPVLRMTGISKSFGSNIALGDVDLTLNKSEILGLVGENGAGKSTLMKILSGSCIKDSGEIYINGSRVEINDPNEAKSLGISTIYQELSLFPHLNATENIFINSEIHRGGLFGPLNDDEMRRKANYILSNELLANIDIKIPIKYLSLGAKQFVEIARSLCGQSEIIIMDEPTSALQAEESEKLFNVIQKLKGLGSSVIYVSHHLDEVLRLCDRVMVLRDGKKVADLHANELVIDKVINLMIGKSVKQFYVKSETKKGDTLLDVNNLCHDVYFRNISFQIKKGEVIGIAGLAGSGQNELMRALFGVLKYNSGTISMNGHPIKINKPGDAIRNKIAFLPGDRKTEGLFLGHDIRWNMSIACLDKISKVLIRDRIEFIIVNEFVMTLGVKARSIFDKINTLSGGNQQKVMLARWLMTEPELLLLEEPTRGIDVNAKSEVYSLITNIVNEEKSVAIVSSDNQELVEICDRLLIMNKGKFTADIDTKKITKQIIAQYSLN